MKLNPPITLAAAAELLGCTYAGPPEHLITGINEIHRVEAGDLTFVDIEKYYNKALTSPATTIIINKEIAPPNGKGLIVSENPFRDYNRLAEHFRPRRPLDNTGDPKFGPDVKIGSNVALGENVRLGKGVEIGHNSVIGNNVTIGDYTLIYPNVSIYDHTQIGSHCCINAGAVIGGEAFYFKSLPDRKIKMLSKGRVIIHDHVDIGANTTIDRGVSADTIVGEYTKIDNLVQIGHDSIIGKRCIIAAQTGIAGVVNIEDDVILWGQVGVSKDLTIGKGAVLYAKTGLMSDLEGGQAYGGIIADSARNFLKKEAIMRRLLEIMPNIENLLREKDLKKEL